MPDLENNISRMLHQFDPLSLILLLEHLGYDHEQILFRSHPSICSQDALFQEIEFRRHPTPHAVVSINLGLLSAQTPLPSYFLKKLEQDALDAVGFIKFLQFFDHPLLLNFFHSIYPEIHPRIFPRRKDSRRQMLLILNQRSPATLHWMFRLIFPELDVRVEKAIMQRSVHVTPFIVGEGVLGHDAVLGRSRSVPMHGRRVTLLSDTEFTPWGAPWPKEILQRLESEVFPILRAVGLDLEIFLVLRTRRSWAKLQAGSYLGYDVFKGGREQPRRILIFAGHLVE